MLGFGVQWTLNCLVRQASGLHSQQADPCVFFLPSSRFSSLCSSRHGCRLSSRLSPWPVQPPAQFQGAAFALPSWLASLPVRHLRPLRLDFAVSGMGRQPHRPPKNLVVSGSIAGREIPCTWASSSCCCRSFILPQPRTFALCGHHRAGVPSRRRFLRGAAPAGRFGPPMPLTAGQSALGVARRRSTRAQAEHCQHLAQTGLGFSKKPPWKKALDYL